MNISEAQLGPSVEATTGPHESNLQEPRYEAAFFYALFLRGYPLERLREDIDVSPKVLQRWQRLAAGDPWYRATLERMLSYRKEVLAIFDSLVLREPTPSAARIQ
jgi:hypothetical protein